MKTKIATIAAAVALTVASASAFAINGTVGEGRVDFEGRVNAVSCSVGVNGTDYKNSRVDLENVDVSELHAKTLVKAKPVDIVVGGCTGVALNNLSVKWSSGALANGDNSSYLANTEEVGATGVYLALSRTNEISGLVDVSNDAGYEGVTLDGKRVFAYNVGYVLGNEVKSGNEVNAGRVSSFATYQVDYQ